MEFCEGLDLNKFIKEYKNKNEFINEKIIYNIVLEICLGIKEIHKQNLIHRDLKPENIFIDKNHNIKIGDFGISKQLDINDKYAYTAIGTGKYMSPEVVKGERHNNKVDIWGFGCIIYELLTLNACFESKSLLGFVNKIINEKHGNIDCKKYNPKRQYLIDLLLQKEYKERPDIDEVYNFIKKELNDEIKIIKSLTNEEFHKLKNNDAKISYTTSKKNIFNLYIYLINSISNGLC